MLYDAELSKKGLGQVQALRDSDKFQEVLERAQVVITSPLTRAIQTCLNLFGDSQIPILVSALHAEIMDSSCDGRDCVD